MNDSHLEDTREPEYEPEIHCPDDDAVMLPTYRTVMGHQVFKCTECGYTYAPGEDDRY